MARALIAAAAALVAVPANAAPICEATAPWAMLGEAHPFPAPDPAAVESNAAGTRLYREHRWEQARAAYRAALARDPSFLGPRLNIACSYVRQERYDEAVREVTALVERAYLPWAREIREAADLSALQPRAEWGVIERVAAAAGERWGAAAHAGIVYLARRKPPLRTPGQGVFVLAPRQELVAYVPSTGRHLQLTAEDGRVLAFARSSDGRRIVYVVGSKLVREGTGPARLRELSLRTLELPSLRLGPPVRVEGDVIALDLYAPNGAGASVRLVSAQHPDGKRQRFTGVAVVDDPQVPAASPVVRIDGSGARGSARTSASVCGVKLEGAARGLLIRRGHGPPAAIDAPFGAALAGLPFAESMPLQP